MADGLQIKTVFCWKICDLRMWSSEMRRYPTHFFQQKFVPINGEEQGIGDSDNRACCVCVCEGQFRVDWGHSYLRSLIEGADLQITWTYTQFNTWRWITSGPFPLVILWITYSYVQDDNDIAGFECILYNQRDAAYTMFFIIISALHVSGGISVHNQKLIKLYVQPWVLSCSSNPSTPAVDSRKAWQYPTYSFISSWW